MVLDLGDGDDVASIDPSLKIPVIFNGADGRDGLFGGGGTDIFDGGAGDDNIISRDDRAEQVTCGVGRDARERGAGRPRAGPAASSCPTRCSRTTRTTRSR